MLPHIQTMHLPRLRGLHIQTRSIIFTGKELEAWGSRNGWSELQHLSVSRASHLIPFISRVPQLTTLHLVADHGQGMQELEDYLQHYQDKPLGVVDILVYNHSSWADDISDAIYHTMPWSILAKVSATLTNYQSVHQPRVVFDPGYLTLSTDDLSRFQVLCPGVTDLTLDIDFTLEHATTNVLEHLGHFDRLAHLMLYVHRPSQRAGPSQDNPLSKFNSEADCGKAFGLIIQTRTKLQARQSLRVGFKEVCNYDVMENNWHAPDWTFWVNAAGQHKHRKRGTDQRLNTLSSIRAKLVSLSCQELARDEQMLQLMIDRPQISDEPTYRGEVEAQLSDYRREIAHRTRVGGMYDDDSQTLYDRWTQART
ncbi:hypothetical protein EJ02DRAFT_24934 [Clathrospora elynae]|uniref:Uncharacterized protein n=1 Tax=Clathrospora elynae TaxID=706981 RepID=A0A6A5T4T4_9PLEO|nr:hypothetical protein EJ02DRAFT_24934 [Clathrospora elynae]